MYFWPYVQRTQSTSQVDRPQPLKDKSGSAFWDDFHKFACSWQNILDVMILNVNIVWAPLDAAAAKFCERVEGNKEIYRVWHSWLVEMERKWDLQGWGGRKGGEGVSVE